MEGSSQGSQATSSVLSEECQIDQIQEENANEQNIFDPSNAVRLVISSDPNAEVNLQDVHIIIESAAGNVESHQLDLSSIDHEDFQVAHSVAAELRNVQVAYSSDAQVETEEPVKEEYSEMDSQEVAAVLTDLAIDVQQFNNQDLQVSNSGISVVEEEEEQQQEYQQQQQPEHVEQHDIETQECMIEVPSSMNETATSSEDSVSPAQFLEAVTNSAYTLDIVKQPHKLSIVNPFDKLQEIQVASSSTAMNTSASKSHLKTYLRMKRSHDETLVPIGSPVASSDINETSMDGGEMLDELRAAINFVEKTEEGATSLTTNTAVKIDEIPEDFDIYTANMADTNHNSYEVHMVKTLDEALDVVWKHERATGTKYSISQSYGEFGNTSKSISNSLIFCQFCSS